MNIAVMCPSNIASRRFMPALAKVSDFTYVGVGASQVGERAIGLINPDLKTIEREAAFQREQAEEFVSQYGGELYPSYQSLIEADEVDAVYLPLPPALHHPWAKHALSAGKHVLVEKPFTTSLAETRDLLETSRAHGLAVHENYMFAFHSQIDWLKRCLSSGRLGETRLIRIDFGFPFRGQADFRYSRALGGGSLLDAGGYTIKLASMLLGPTARVSTAHLNGGKGLDVDLYGSVTMEDADGLVAQLAFGMDNDYRCTIDVWGSEATLTNGRILTAPDGLAPTMIVRRNGVSEEVTLEPDDSFQKSIEHFALCIQDEQVANERRGEIEREASLIEDVFSTAQL